MGMTIGKNDNIAYTTFKFNYEGKTIRRFMVSIKGSQFMPGTYVTSEGNMNYDPFALINTLFPPFWDGQNLAYGHSERKIYLTLYS